MVTGAEEMDRAKTHSETTWMQALGARSPLPGDGVDRFFNSACSRRLGWPVENNRVGRLGWQKTGFFYSVVRPHHRHAAVLLTFWRTQTD